MSGISLESILQIAETANLQTEDVGEGIKVGQFSSIGKGVKIGSNCVVGSHCSLEGNIVLGQNVTIENGVIISGLGSIVIGDNAVLGVRTTLQVVENSTIKLLRGCKIGANVVIKSGLTIGEYAQIEDGSVVTRNVPSYQIWSGNPAQHTGFFRDSYANTKNNAKGNFSPAHLANWLDNNPFQGEVYCDQMTVPMYV